MIYFPWVRKPNRAREIHQRILRQRMGCRVEKGGWYRQCRRCAAFFRPGQDTANYHDTCCCRQCAKEHKLVMDTINGIWVTNYKRMQARKRRAKKR